MNTAVAMASNKAGLAALVLDERLQRSVEQVHTSAAPFFRHLLVPSSQQPLSSTTATKEVRGRGETESVFVFAFY